MQLRAVFSIVCAGFATPVYPTPDGAASSKTTLSADHERNWVSFSLTPGNQIRFAMTLNGRAVTAILDTGASDSIVSRRSPAAATATVHSGGTARAIGGKVVPIGWMPIERLSFGAVARHGGRMAVASLPASASGGGQPVDLLIGRDLLASYALDIDYPLKRFRLLRSGRLPFAGATAPLAITPARKVYETAVTIGSARLSPVLVDTGDGSGLTVTHVAWQRVAPAGLRTTTAIGFGLSGPLVTTLAILPTILIGDVYAREVETRVEPEGGFSATIGAAGRIGSGLLGRYRVLLDPGAGRMVVAPGRNSDVPPLRSTSGLLVGVLPERLRVLHVMANSPAAGAGWREGDLICAINGQPIGADYPSRSLARWSAAPAGTRTRLADCAGRERTLESAIFY